MSDTTDPPFDLSCAEDRAALVAALLGMGIPAVLRLDTPRPVICVPLVTQSGGQVFDIAAFGEDCPALVGVTGYRPDPDPEAAGDPINAYSTDYYGEYTLGNTAAQVAMLWGARERLVAAFRAGHFDDGGLMEEVLTECGDSIEESTEESTEDRTHWTPERWEKYAEDKSAAAVESERERICNDAVNHYYANETCPGAITASKLILYWMREVRVEETQTAHDAISHYDLSVRAWNVLRKNDYLTRSEVVEAGASAIWSLRHCGAAVYGDIVDTLKLDWPPCEQVKRTRKR